MYKEQKYFNHGKKTKYGWIALWHYHYLTFCPLEAEGPALVVGDEEGDGVAALAAAEVGQVARVDAVVGAQVGVCKRTTLDLANNVLRSEVEGILELGHFSFVVQLIPRTTTTGHHNKQFLTQGFLLPQFMVELMPRDLRGDETLIARDRRSISKTKSSWKIIIPPSFEIEMMRKMGLGSNRDFAIYQIFGSTPHKKTKKGGFASVGIVIHDSYEKKQSLATKRINSWPRTDDFARKFLCWKELTLDSWQSSTLVRP